MISSWFQHLFTAKVTNGAFLARVTTFEEEEHAEKVTAHQHTMADRKRAFGKNAKGLLQLCCRMKMYGTRCDFVIEEAKATKKSGRQ